MDGAELHREFLTRGMAKRVVVQEAGSWVGSGVLAHQFCCFGKQEMMIIDIEGREEEPLA